MTSIAFLMANGIPIDDMSVSADEQEESFNPSARVHSVSECRKAVEWKNHIRREYYGTKEPGQPTHPTVILLSLSDWTDGFGPGKVKNNRNSVDVKSFTIPLRSTW